MTPERIRALLKPYLNSLPDGIEFKVQNYMALLERWGAKIPLTSIHDPEKIVRFHFGESIFALSAGDIRKGRLADVGSGAGFPGLAIKLASPALSVTLIETNKKKCVFLHEVTRDLELGEVEILSKDFESSRIQTRSLSSVSCRGLGRHNSVIHWANDRLGENGAILLWVGHDDAQAIRAISNWNWSLPALIPGTSGRFLLRGTKVS